MERAMIRLKEEWVDITEDIVPGILPIYKISTFGNVYSKSINRIMKLEFAKGYFRIGLRTINGSIHVLIHRLVKIAFDPIANYEEYQVDHKNAYKNNNALYNLDWVTNEENRMRAYNNNLFSTGEDVHRSSIDNNQAKVICENLQEGKSYEEIMDILGISDRFIYPIIYNIHTRRSWVWISKNYTFPEFKCKDFKTFTDNQVHKICGLLLQGYQYKSILECIGYELDRLPEKQLGSYVKTISSIKKGRVYNHIGKIYGF